MKYVMVQGDICMKDKLKTKKQLIDELSKMHKKIADMEESITFVNNDEKVLWAREQKYRLLIENSHDIIYTLDPEGVFTFVSPGWTALLGHPVNQVVGKRFHQFVHPDDIAVCEAFLRKVINKGQRKAGVEYRVRHIDGSWRWHTSNAAPLRNEAGIIISYEGNARDITERKQTEGTLRESENRYRAIFENTGTANAILEEDKIISLVNTEFEKLSGYTREEIEGRKSWAEFVVKEDLEKMANQHRLRRIDTDAARKSYEFRFIDKNGRIKNIYLNVDLIPGTKKSITSLQDITARKQAEEALKESQQQFSDIINFLPDATFVIDKGGKVIAWNRAMEEMTGIKAADMVGKDSYEYALAFYGDRRPILIDLVLQPRKDIEEKYIRTDRQDMFLEAEVYLPSLRGKEVYLFGKASILRDSKGNIVGAIESIRDITVGRQAEKALKYSEERFSKAFHMSPAPTIINTIDEGRYIDVNDSFLRMLGYTREEIIGHTAVELYIWPDVDNRRYIVNKLRSQGFLRGEMLHLQTKTGEMRDVRMSSEIIALNENKFVLSICYDTTDQEKLESQLRQAQKMEAIGTLAGGIAHDFNNILGAVMGYTEMALGLPIVDDRLRRYLMQIFKASERARDLVKQILTFSRKGNEKLTSLRVSPVIKEVLKLLRASLPSTIEIYHDIQSEPDTVLADSTQIHQILMNLCTNAAYAMPEKKGEIKVSLVSEEIKSDDPCGLIPGMYLKLTVSDTGIGMDSATMGRIFDPFFTTKKTGEGTGLGLSVVYGIVKSYGGTITVQSEVEKGTEFCVYLPLFMRAEDNKEAQQEESVSRGKERILFVDDEEMLVELGKSILASMGYDVVGMTSSLAALELFNAHPEQFDLVITDMTMPNMTGMELAKKLLQIKPEIPVILCTGFSETVTLESVKSIGLKDLIMKPFKQHQIAESIRRTLDKK